MKSTNERTYKTITSLECPLFSLSFNLSHGGRRKGGGGEEGVHNLNAILWLHKTWQNSAIKTSNLSTSAVTVNDIDLSSNQPPVPLPLLVSIPLLLKYIHIYSTLHSRHCFIITVFCTFVLSAITVLYHCPISLSLTPAKYEVYSVKGTPPSFILLSKSGFCATPGHTHAHTHNFEPLNDKLNDTMQQ